MNQFHNGHPLYWIERPALKSEVRNITVNPNETGSSKAAKHLLRVREYLMEMCKFKVGSRQRAVAMEGAVFEILDYLEAQASQSPTTEPATTALPLAAQGDSTLLETLALWQQLGVLTEAERSHVAQCFDCRAHLERFLVWFKTHAQVADGITSTSAKLEY